MKRLVTGILISVLALIAAACSGSGGTDATPAASPSAGPQMGVFTSDDLLFTAGGAAFALRSDVAPLLAALGEDYDYSEAISCVFEGFDKTYDYGDVAIYTNPDGKADLINEIIVYSERYPTAKGVAVGSSRTDVVAAYGEPHIDDNGIYTYVDGDPADLANPRLLIDLTEGTVAWIDYYYPTNITD